MQGKENGLHNVLEEADLSVKGMIAVLGGISLEVVVHRDGNEEQVRWWDHHPKKETIQHTYFFAALKKERS